MPDQDIEVQIQDNFYRDSFGRVVFYIIALIGVIVVLAAISLYMYWNRPPPIVFLVDEEWRVQPDVPVNQPYLTESDLLQWVTDAIPTSFVLDFVNYNNQLKNSSQYFTSAGWQTFLNQLNIYANYNNVQTNKMFVNAFPAGAPFIINEGLLSGRYAWWVQMPINITYAGFMPAANKKVTLQVLIVRVPTLNNLNGVGIENVIVVSSNSGALPV